jgi:hypothetical protein
MECTSVLVGCRCSSRANDTKTTIHHTQIKSAERNRLPDTGECTDNGLKDGTPYRVNVEANRYYPPGPPLAAKGD